MQALSISKACLSANTAARCSKAASLAASVAHAKDLVELSEAHPFAADPTFEAVLTLGLTATCEAPSPGPASSSPSPLLFSPSVLSLR